MKDNYNSRRKGIDENTLAMNYLQSENPNEANKIYVK